MVHIFGLNKSYGKKQVLYDIRLTLQGGVIGLLGPNGAGKTTLFRCLVGMENYQGDIRLGGSGRIGYLPQDFDCFHELTVAEAMDYIALMKGASLEENPSLLEKVELWDNRRVKVKRLSGGMKRRLGVAQALIGKPELVLMDEPTVGLDPESRLQVRNLVAGLGCETTILLSSHIASDMDAVADQLVLLKEGRICCQGSREELLSRMRGKVAEVTMTGQEYRGNRLPCTSVRWDKELAVVRLVGDGVPQEHLVSPVLKDVYFYYEGQKSV